MAIAAGTVNAQDQLAIVQDDRISESSGMAISRRHDDALWIHNDSGDKPRLFLVGFDGNTRGVVNLQKARAIDWEDMCSFELDGEQWLLIGDVGDNNAERTKKRSPYRLYLIREPLMSDEQSKISRRWDVEIDFEYEDGPHNCESVAVDARQNEILLLTKESPFSTGVYRLPLNLKNTKQSETAQRIARLPAPYPTAMDISPDGRVLVAVTMSNGWICHRLETQSWKQALSSNLHRFTLPPRKQGETVCFSRDGRFLFLNSEHKRQPLWRLQVGTVRPQNGNR